MATSYWRPEVNLWNASTGQQTGKILGTGSADNSIKFWDTTTWSELLSSIEHKEYVCSLAFSPDGKRFASAALDGTMKLWNVATNRELAPLKLGLYGYHITFSPDGQTLAAWDGSSIRLWRAPALDRKPSRPREA